MNYSFNIFLNTNSSRSLSTNNITLSLLQSSTPVTVILSNGSSTDITLKNNKGLDEVVAVLYNNSKLTFSSEFTFGENYINLPISISLTGAYKDVETTLILVDDTLSTDIDFFDSNEIQIPVLSSLFVQQSFSDTVYFNYLVGFDYESITLSDTSTGDTILLGNGTFNLNETKSLSLTVVYKVLTSTPPDVYTTYTKSKNITVIHNIYLPVTSMSVKFDTLLTGSTMASKYNDVFINSDYTNVSYNTRNSARSLDVEFVKYETSELGGNVLQEDIDFSTITNSTSSTSYTLEQYTVPILGDYILTTYRNVAVTYKEVLSEGSILIDSDKYYVVSNSGTAGNYHAIYTGTCSGCTAGDTYTMPNLGGAELIHIEEDVIFNTPLLIVSGSITINGTSYTVGDKIIYNSFDTVSILSNYGAVILDTDYNSSQVKNLKNINEIEIQSTACNTYTIYNGSLNTITINVVKYNFTSQIQYTEVLIENSTMLPNATYNLGLSSDGVYKLTISNSPNSDGEYIIINMCNTEDCIANYINELLCCESAGDCDCDKYDEDCKYKSATNATKYILLYNTLTDILDYNYSLSIPYNKFNMFTTKEYFTIDKIINKIVNLCNECN